MIYFLNLVQNKNLIKKCLETKFLGREKLYGRKNFRVKKIFGLKKCLGQKKIGYKIFLG